MIEVTNANAVLVVAHPGDETLGCARLLLRQPASVCILHVADGVTHDPRALRRSGARSAADFVRIRRDELLAAMQVFGIDESQVHSAGIPELEAPLQMQKAVESILVLLRRESPREVHTHPFEGGHPDTDAVCFAVHHAVKILEEAGEVRPAIIEFTGYHSRDGLFRSAEFLSPYPMAQISVLDEEERERKEKALRCFRSQYDLYGRFSCKEERWRRAEPYDFHTRPHPGPLYYELASTGYSWSDFAQSVNATSPEAPQTEPQPQSPSELSPLDEKE